VLQHFSNTQKNILVLFFIRFIPAFLLERVAVAATLRNSRKRNQNTSRFSTISNSSAGLQQDGTKQGRRSNHLLEHLDMLQCIAAYLQRALAWVPCETQYIGLFSCEFSCPLAQMRLKTDEGSVQRMQAVPIVRKKQAFDPATFNSGALVYSAVTIYPIHVDCK